MVADSKTTATFQAFYNGLRLAVAEDHYRLLEKGANRAFVLPIERVLIQLDRATIGLPEDRGNREFRRSHCLETDAPLILYKRTE